MSHLVDEKRICVEGGDTVRVGRCHSACPGRNGQVRGTDPQPGTGRFVRGTREGTSKVSAGDPRPGSGPAPAPTPVGVKAADKTRG